MYSSHARLIRWAGGVVGSWHWYTSFPARCHDKTKDTRPFTNLFSSFCGGNPFRANNSFLIVYTCGHTLALQEKEERSGRNYRKFLIPIQRRNL
jgi:hypothetical protein